MGDGEFSYPRAAAVAPNRDVFIVDKSGRIQRFDEQGRFLLAWRMPEIAAGKPTGLAVGSSGEVFAADTHYARVVVFDPTGRELRRFGEWGDGTGQFRLPTDVAIAADGSIYVGEYGGNDRISKFDRDGHFLFSFGGAADGAAHLNRPQSLCMLPSGDLWVADACNHRLCLFSGEGKLIRTIGEVGDGAGQLRFPYSVDVLADGTLVVCEYGNNRVSRFAADGRFLGWWGAAGRHAGELAYPWAAAVVDGRRLFVIDSGNNRVQVFDALRAGVWRGADGASAGASRVGGRPGSG